MSDTPQIQIAGRAIGPGQPTYVVAELSANHGGDLNRAKDLVHAAAQAGADAIKLQTYTADTLTLDVKNDHFKIGSGSLWDGRYLYDLYQEASTPWAWHAELCALANSLGLACFSSPFDESAVDFLETLDVPAYKVASFELVDLPLIARIARTKKPVILSTGMAVASEIDDAVRVLREAGAPFALLRTNSGYPAAPEEMNLRAMPFLAERYHTVVGLSDHTLGTAVAVAAVALGASILEKHLTGSRADGGPDAAFSLEPHELKAMVEAVRTVEAALGRAELGPSDRERQSLPFRRSLFVVEDVRAGEVLTSRNVRSIRPAAGLPPKHLGEILGRKAACDLAKGTPLSWDLIS